MSISSTNLLSDSHFQVTRTMFNTIINGIRDCFTNSTYNLFPSLNESLIRYEYNRLIDKPNMTLHFSCVRSEYRFFFFKINNEVYQVITDFEVNTIHQITRISF